MDKRIRIDVMDERKRVTLGNLTTQEQCDAC